jgi:putative ABC transport system permease protein
MLALGVYLSYRIARFADITVDGTLTTGAVCFALVSQRGGSPWMGLALAFLAGGLGGAVTGGLFAWLRVSDLLAGILTMTALYSINLRMLGGSNLPVTGPEFITGGLPEGIPRGVGVAGVYGVLVLGLAVALRQVLRSDAGIAWRASGENPDLSTALGVPALATKVLLLTAANGFAAMSGALSASYNGFADISSGIGSLVTGIGALMIGERLVSRRGQTPLSPEAGLIAAILGAITYRLLVTAALNVGLAPTDLRLITAALVLGAIAIPRLRGLIPARRPRSA